MDSFFNNLENEIVKLTLNLYGNLKLPKNVVQIFVDTLNNLFMPFLQEQLKLRVPNIDSHVINTIKATSKFSQSIFKKFNTNYKSLLE